MMDTKRQDHVTLLAMDAERSLQGLMHSLSVGANGMPKGALHAIDLVSALASVGLTSASHLMQSMAHHLSAGQPLVLEVARDVSAWLEQALQGIRTGHPLDHAQVDDKVAHWTRQLNALPAQPASQAGPFDGNVQALSEAAFAQTASQHVHPLQVFQKNGLDLLQYARVLNALPASDRSIQRIDHLLSELQDRAVLIGQKPLQELYDQHHSDIEACWLDSDIFLALQAFSNLSDRAQRITAIQRNLTLFIEWQGVSLSEEETSDVAQMLMHAHGHLKQLANGYCLVLPCSRHRMWMQPYLADGRTYAISAAQVRHMASAETGKPASLEVCVGLKCETLEADQRLPQESMNIHRIPPNFPRPAGVTAVALNGHGEVFLFRSLT